MPETLQPRMEHGHPAATEWFYATKPTRGTLFWRTFLPWQIWRFIWINAKMVRIIRRGHEEL